MKQDPLVDITRLKLKTLHPCGVELQRILIFDLCDNCGAYHTRSAYSLGVPEEDTVSAHFLRQRGVLQPDTNDMALTPAGLMWIEATLRQFGGRPNEIFNTVC